MSYDNDSNVLARQTRAGATIYFTYDTLNRLSTKTAPSEPAVNYSYDLASRLTGVSDNSAAITAPATTASYATNLTYDQLNRPLTANWSPVPAQTTPSSSVSSNFSFAYDATNRRISQSGDPSWWSYPATATNVSYTPNNLNQYTAVGSVSPSYDGNGNLTADGTFTYGYDAENRLVSASGTGLAASYAYDAQGRRKSKTVNGTTAIFVTDANNREVLEYNGSSGALQNWYSYALGSNDALNQMNIASGTRATFIPDILGSFVGVLDATSGSLTKFGYQTYGESGAATGSFRYTGQRIDPETNGLYYYHARMYIPGWGRFMQPDPIGYASGANLYAYVGNDPLNVTDSTGLAQDNPVPNNQSNNVSGSAPITNDVSSSAGPGAGASGANSPNNPDQAQAGNIQLVSDIPRTPGYLSGTFPECDFCGMMGGPRGSRAESDFYTSPSDTGSASGQSFYRGALPGQEPSFAPRPNEFRVDPSTGTVLPGRGVSVFDNPASVSSKGFDPHEVDPNTVPGQLQIIQRGGDPSHYEIAPKPGTNLTPDQYKNLLCQICTIPR